MLIKCSSVEGGWLVWELWQIFILFMRDLLGLPVGQHVAEAKERGEIAHKAKDSDTYGQKPMKTKHNTAR